MKRQTKQPPLSKTPFQKSFDESSPQYNRPLRIHFNSGHLLRKNQSHHRTSMSFRLLRSKDKISSSTSFSNITHRTLSKKIQRNVDDSGLFSDDKWKRSEVLVSRRRGEGSAGGGGEGGRMPEILTQRSNLAGGTPKEDLALLKQMHEGSSLRQRKETLRRADIEEEKSSIVYPEIVEKERKVLFVKRDSFVKKSGGKEKRWNEGKGDDIGIAQWEKNDFVGFEPTTIQQYIAEKIDKGGSKIKRKYNKKIIG